LVREVSIDDRMREKVCEDIDSEKEAKITTMSEKLRQLHLLKTNGSARDHGAELSYTEYTNLHKPSVSCCLIPVWR
jgi:hypothetical protein